MTDIWIDVDTAVTVPVNVLSLIDDTDFKTREIGIVYNQAGMDLVWNFQTTAGATTQTAVTPTTAGVYDWAHSGDAMYKIEIPASGGGSINNDTEGVGWFTGICTGVLAWRGPFIGFRAAELNALLIDDAYSATRGLAGTALPAAAADAAGGLPISDAGGQDFDSIISTLVTDIIGKTSNANLRDSIREVISVVESQRESHTHQSFGNIFYVDPVGGNTHASGNRGGISDPYSLVQDCHDNAVIDSNHDLIILLSGAAAGATTLTEDVILSKRYLFIRGPGRDFIWTRTGNGDTIAITGDGIELKGFQLNTAATGSGNGIQATDADALLVARVWVNDTRGDGVNILRGSNCIIRNNVFRDTGQGGSGQGVDIVGTAGSSNDNKICGNTFSDCAGDSIKISGGTTLNTDICLNHIHGSAGYGINIGASSTDAMVIDNRLGNNASGDIVDAGTTTTEVNNEPYAVEIKQDATDIVIATILADTNELQTDWTSGGRLDIILTAILLGTGTTLPAQIAALNNVSTAQVLAQINAALDTAIPELAIGVPSATPTMRTAMMLLYMALRNRLDVQTSGIDSLQVYNDAGMQIAEKLITDDSADYSEAKMT